MLDLDLFILGMIIYGLGEGELQDNLKFRDIMHVLNQGLVLEFKDNLQHVMHE